MNLLDRGMIAVLKKHEQEVTTLKAQRDSLLKACKELTSRLAGVLASVESCDLLPADEDALEMGRAAIASVEKEAP